MSTPTGTWRDPDHPLHHLWAWVLATALVNLLSWGYGWPMWVL